MADHIQIGDIEPRIEHAGDGATTTFSYPFPVFADSNLRVFVDGVEQTVSTDFTVAGAGQSAGGSVTFTTAPSPAATVLLCRDLTIARMSDFQASGEFRAKVINDELDFLTAVMQELNSDLSRTVRLRRTDAQADLELPAASMRADRVLAFDEEGDVTVKAYGDLGAVTIISPSVPLAGSGAGAPGTSSQLSAADHRHPLPGLTDIGVASQAEAEAGSNNSKAMTPLRAAQAIAALFDGVDPVARDMAASALAYSIAANDASSIVGSVGSFILADDFETDSLSVSTNASYDSNGDYYANPGTVFTASSSSEWAGQTGEYTFPGGDIEVSANDNTIYLNDDFTGDFEFQFTYKTDETVISIIAVYEAVNKASIVPANNAQAFSGWFWNNHGGTNQLSNYDNLDLNSANDFSMSGQVSDGDVVVIGRSGTSIYLKVNGEVVHNFATTSEATLSVLILQGNGSSGHLLDVSWSVPGTPQNMILSPAAAALDTPDPSDVLGYFVIEPVDSVTFGTDLIGKVSVDGGATKTAGTWTKVGDIGDGGEELWRLEVDLSAQSGSSLTYEITTANGKEIRLHHCVGLAVNY